MSVISVLEWILFIISIFWILLLNWVFEVLVVMVIGVGVVIVVVVFEVIYCMGGMFVEFIVFVWWCYVLG